MTGVWDWVGRNGSNISLTLLSVAIGLIISWYFFRRQKEPKHLDYAYTSVQSLSVEGGSDVPDSLMVAWKEQIDDSPSSCLLYTSPSPRDS